MEVVNVKMAEIQVARAPALLKTTLGSCVGVVLHDVRKNTGGLAHVMLPRRSSRDESVGKYADTAIPALLDLLRAAGSRQQDLTALIAGGANMFRMAMDGAIATIGAKNVEAVKSILAELRIPITFEDTGGDQGRTVVFDTATVGMTVKKLERIAVRREG
jgi:chemotaxis protein CheD